MARPRMAIRRLRKVQYYDSPLKPGWKQSGSLSRPPRASRPSARAWTGRCPMVWMTGRLRSGSTAQEVGGAQGL